MGGIPESNCLGPQKLPLTEFSGHRAVQYADDRFGEHTTVRIQQKIVQGFFQRERQELQNRSCTSLSYHNQDLLILMAPF